METNRTWISMCQTAGPLVTIMCSSSIGPGSADTPESLTIPQFFNASLMSYVQSSSQLLSHSIGGTPEIVFVLQT